MDGPFEGKRARETRVIVFSFNWFFGSDFLFSSPSCQRATNGSRANSRVKQSKSRGAQHAAGHESAFDGTRSVVLNKTASAGRGESFVRTRTIVFVRRNSVGAAKQSRDTLGPGTTTRSNRFRSAPALGSAA